MLTRTIQKALEVGELLRFGRHVVVGVSGGADSVALTYALLHLRERLDLTLTLAHLNHRLRGRDAQRDEQFVRDLAVDEGLPCVVEGQDVRGLARRRGWSLEMAAREARYAFFRRAVGRVGGHVVATGHTSDDQVETVLLRFFRGTGRHGLRGIQREADLSGLHVIRPMLDITHDQVVRYLQQHQVAWCEDASNRDPAFMRNRLRHEILPLLEKRMNPRVREAVRRHAEIAGEEDAWLDGQVDIVLAAAREEAGAHLRIDVFEGCPVALRRRLILRWLITGGVEPAAVDLDAIERVLKLANSVRGTRKVLLAHGRCVVRRYGLLALEHTAEVVTGPAYRVCLNRRGETLLLEQGWRVVIEEHVGFSGKVRGHLGVMPVEAWLSREAVGRAGLYLRNWQHGDRMRPTGMTGSRKLQDIFVDKKLPRDGRCSWPVLENRGRVAWLPGYSVDRDWCVPEGEAPSLHLRIEPIA